MSRVVWLTSWNGAGSRLVFSLHGRTGVRRYALISTGGKQWLLHLTKEQPPRP